MKVLLVCNNAFIQGNGICTAVQSLLVYLAEAYCSDTTSRYPVLYLFHGARGEELAWIEKGDILHTVDSLTATGKMSPTIIVMPTQSILGDDRKL